MEQEVIADIARRVKKTGRYTETAELMAKSMREQGYSTAKIQAEVMKVLRADKNYQMTVAENTKAYKQMITNIIKDTVHKAKKAGEKLIAEAGLMSWNNDLSMWKQHGVDLKKPNDMSQLIEAFKKQTVGELKNIARSMGFKNTVLGTTGVLQAYQREMDLATLKVASGTFSYDQAVNDCIKRLAESGLRSIDYANGRSYQLDTAARMCVRTGMSQLAGKITEMNLKATGQDLVRTSQHMGSRPEHVPWQNKIFSYSGKSKKYPDFFKETGYGTVSGLKGANCTHDFYPHWEGDYIPPDVEVGEEYYKNTQKQRAMERGIRATKREIEAQNAIGGDTTQLKAKLRQQEKAYRDFSKEVGIRPKENRLVVVSGSSNLKSSKISNSAKSIVNILKDDIIKASNLTVVKAKKIVNRIERSRIIQEAIDRKEPIYAEDLRIAYKKYRVPQKEGFYDVVIHGAPHYLEYEKEFILDQESLYYIISGRKDYKGDAIRLLSCSTGKADKYGNCVAQYLSDKLNVDIYAPIDVLNINPNGKLTVGRKDLSEKEGFKLFKPRKE